MKKCPFCAEEIQDEAVKCCCCGKRLTPCSRDANRDGDEIHLCDEAARNGTLVVPAVQEHRSFMRFMKENIVIIAPLAVILIAGISVGLMALKNVNLNTYSCRSRCETVAKDVCTSPRSTGVYSSQSDCINVLRQDGVVDQCVSDCAKSGTVDGGNCLQMTRSADVTYGNLTDGNVGTPFPTTDETNSAIIAYSYAARIYPDCANALFKRGVLYSKKSTRDQNDPKNAYAINDVIKAAELNPNYRSNKEYYMALSTGYSHIGDHARNLSIIHEWARNMPDDSFPYFVLSIEYAKRCDFALAERYASLAEQHGNPVLANLARMDFNRLCTELHVP